MEGVGPELRDLIGKMHELAMILRKRRFARGALELNMPEIEVDLGEKGEVVGAHLAVNDESHQLIEEFMLAANEAVASFPTEQDVGPPGSRLYADPGARKLKEFALLAWSPSAGRSRTRQSRFDLQKVLAASADKPGGAWLKSTSRSPAGVSARRCTRRSSMGITRPASDDYSPFHLADPPLS